MPVLHEKVNPAQNSIAKWSRSNNIKTWLKILLTYNLDMVRPPRAYQLRNISIQSGRQFVLRV